MAECPVCELSCAGGLSSSSGGGAHLWQGGSQSWQGGSQSWQGGSQSWQGGSQSWQGGAQASPMDGGETHLGARRQRRAAVACVKRRQELRVGRAPQSRLRLRENEH